jgi:hypothetical protein
VDVQVHHAGHEGASLRVDHFRIRRQAGAFCVPCADAFDVATLDDDHRVLQGLTAEPVDQCRALDDLDRAVVGLIEKFLGLQSRSSWFAGGLRKPLHPPYV